MAAEPPQPHRDDWNHHWDAYEPAARINPAQEFRSRLVMDALALAPGSSALRVLDIGSGMGELARQLLARFPRAEYAGVDISRSGVALSRRKVPAARFFEGDVQQALPLPDAYRGWATHAVCTEVLEHLDEPARALDRVLPWLAPGGRLVVTVPGGPMSALDRHIGHRRHYTPEDLARLLRDAGFEDVAVRAAGFPFFNVYRIAVIVQGDRLTRQAGELGFDSRVAPRLAAKVFGALFRLTTSRTPFGWQTLGNATRPRGGADR